MRWLCVRRRAADSAPRGTTLYDSWRSVAAPRVRPQMATAVVNSKGTVSWPLTGVWATVAVGTFVGTPLSHPKLTCCYEMHILTCYG
jgi:hypothetical protein